MQAILHCDRNWEIGKKNDLMFRLPKDMAFFKGKTRGKVVVMGSNTLLSFPGGKPLKNRTNIVLWPDGDKERAVADGFVMVETLEDLFKEIVKYPPEDVFVIGGAMMYHTMLPYCDKVFLTKVDADGQAEVFFDNLDKLDNWKMTYESEPLEDNGYTIRFTTYENSRVLLPLTKGETQTPKRCRENEARKLAASGLSRKEIAARLGVHIKTVHRYLTDRNYSFIRPQEFKGRPDATETQEQQLALIRKVYRKGDTQTSLVRKTGISAQQMSSLFIKFRLNEEFGIDENFIRSKLQEASEKGRASATAKRKAKAEEHRREVLALAKQGTSVDMIIRHTGLSSTTVRNILKAAGLTKHPQETEKEHLYWLADAMKKERRRLADTAKILKAMEREDVDTQKKISEITGLDPCRVSLLIRDGNLWEKAGREKPKHSSPISEKEITKRKTRILEAYAPDRTEKEIAELSGYDKVTVHRILEENELKGIPEEYDFSDSVIRKSLLGKMFVSNSKEAIVTHFIDTPKGWRVVIGGEPMTAKTFAATYRPF